MPQQLIVSDKLTVVELVRKLERMQVRINLAGCGQSTGYDIKCGSIGMMLTVDC